tara:strand:- start:33 stop:290 length:258 start_codon:yes stop_codon:yes gene_type:complete
MPFVTVDSDNKIVSEHGEATTETIEVATNDARYVTWTNTLKSQEYIYKRLEEYPSIAEQLDNMYHNGFDKWKETIKTVKDKYPKE